MKETKVRKLCRLMRDKFNIKIRPETLKRTRAGYWQRARGAWSWGAYTEDSGEVGSFSTVTDLLKAWPDVEVHPEPNNSMGLEVWEGKDCRVLAR